MLGLMALLAAPLAQAQDYDDIYYDASSAPKQTKTVKVSTPAKTVAVYGEVPERYKVAAQSNYSVERDVDEYNRRGAYEPDYAISIDGDTIYEEDEAFANTRRIERFYNPDIVILSDDDDLVELYYDESPTINLIVGSDYGYGASYGWASSYYPWYTGYYYPWYTTWYDPWYSWYSPWHYSWYGPRLWGWSYWGYRPYYWGWNSWGWNNWGWHGNYGHHYADWGHRGTGYDRRHVGGSGIGSRAGLANNRNTRPRVGQGAGSNRNGIAARGAQGNVGSSRSTGVGSRSRGGYASSRGGNMGSRGTSGVTTRSGGSRQPSVYGGSGRSSGGSYSGGSRSSGGSYSGGSRSSGGSGGSYSGGGSSSRGSSGGGGGGGSRGGSSGGGGHRR